MKNRIHCISEEELFVIKSFGCQVNDYSFLSENGEYVREFTIYCNGLIVGNEESTYSEVTNNILQVKTGSVYC
jgi:hypothetical protein